MNASPTRLLKQYGCLVLGCLVWEAVAVDLPRLVPPPGIELEPGVGKLLEAELDRFKAELDQTSGLDPGLQVYLPDVLIFYKAVQQALQHKEFYQESQIPTAFELIVHGKERLRSLRDGETPWLHQTGLVVRGYQSRIDQSIQPFGLVVPDHYNPLNPVRMDVWLHGRDDRLTELKFVSQRMRSMGEFTPRDTLVLHPYGRYCNAFKFAGETDVFEAMEVVERDYSVDPDRISIRGFSMGGGGCWHLAAHHASRWVFAAPGAGFSETARYLNIAGREVQPPDYEKVLWGWYDATRYAAHFNQTSLVAYSGEKDRQIQAALEMESALMEKGLRLRHVVGPDTEHRYHPDSKEEIASITDALAEVGKEVEPREVHISTPTLKYARQAWAELLGLERHWEQAEWRGKVEDPARLEVQCSNVRVFRLELLAGSRLLSRRGEIELMINGQSISVPCAQTDGSWSMTMEKGEDGWRPRRSEVLGGGKLEKLPGLQGPIDDAFTDGFLFVKPTGTGWHQATERWVQESMEQAVRDWRAQFRGEVQVVDDVDFDQAGWVDKNVVLWGDPNSNRVLGRLIQDLPVLWNRQTVAFMDSTGNAIERFPAAQHLPIFIFPNPVQADRYLVVNSGFTFAYPVSSSNADQTPKLPDYAMADVGKSPWPGGNAHIVQAGFFNEQWVLKPGSVDKVVKEDQVGFIEEIAPIFVRHCLGCHGPEKSKGRFRLDTFEYLMADGEIVKPGRPQESLLYQLIVSNDPEERMPADSDALSKFEIDRIYHWIRQGAGFDGSDRKEGLSNFVPAKLPDGAPDVYQSTPAVTAIAWDPDGNRIYTSGYGEVLVWDWPSTRLVARLRPAPERITGLQVSKTDHVHQLYACGGEPARAGWLLAYDLNDAASPPEILLTRPETIWCVGSYKNEEGRTLLVAGGSDGILTVLDPADKEIKMEINLHADWILDLKTNKSGRLLATASRDHTVRILDLDHFVQLSAWRGGGDPLTAVAWHPDNQTVLSTGPGRGLDRWDYTSGSQRGKSLDYKSDWPLIVLLKGKIWASSESNECIQIDPEKMRIEQRVRLNSELGRITSFASFEPGQILAVGHDTGGVTLVEAGKGNGLKSFRAFPMEDGSR